MLPENIQAIVNEFIPLIKPLAVGRYGIALGGSFGKGVFDTHSDLDLRLYGDDLLSGTEDAVRIRNQAQALIEAYHQQGYRIDGYWPRKIGDIDQMLAQWQEGIIQPLDYTWTVWGYHLLPDVFSQYILDDPFDVLKGWKAQLSIYPPKLKQAVFEKHLKFIRYWRDDYHYINKIRRCDAVFLIGLASKIVHSLIQILFALNETYYIGDGNNLDYVRTFKQIPEGFVEGVEAGLFPENDEEGFIRQRELLVRLINGVESLTPAQP